MPNKNKLSIYMIKSDFNKEEDIIKKYDEKIILPNIGKTFIMNSKNSTPSWLESFFNNSISLPSVFTANAKVVTLISIKLPEFQNTSRTFAIVMGHGKYMLKDNVIEERFGLKVVLNTIKPDSLRRIKKINIGGNQKQSNEQLPLKSNINDFGIDINRDLVGSICGVSDDEKYALGIMTGDDMLSITAEVDINNIKDFLKSTYQKYTLETYRKNFSWIDHICLVRDSRLIDFLNQKAVAEINTFSKSIFMAVPEVIDWTKIRGFKYKKQEIYDDIYIEEVKESLTRDLTDISQLKNKTITAISALDDSALYNWSAYKCLCGEISIDNNVYSISNGKWYCISNNFVKLINDDYSKTIISDIKFDKYTSDHKDEAAYTKDFVKRNCDKYIVMDQKNIPYGGGHSKIELCDILSKKKDLIHIKPYSGSSTLSHLFNQALVSAELIKSDPYFLDAANKKINEQTNDSDFLLKHKTNVCIVFGIISKNGVNLPQIPFFSKVSFCFVKHRLNAFGYSVSIKNIVKEREEKKTLKAS